ncbi:MAG: L-threonylcarbamoyladenylate synthase [Alkaliphilus sp.]
MNNLKNTTIYDIDPNDIDMHKINICSKVLANGGTVAFPTETVYGIGANAMNSEAIKKIFTAKGRPADNPLIVHIADRESVYSLADKVTDKAEALMKVFWPGPLTLILKKSQIVSDIITAGLDTVAIRMPNHPIATRLIKEAGVPIVAPSANISGKPSPTLGKHVIDDLLGRVDIIINGGNCEVGLESTVLDMTTNPPTNLRPGAVTRKMVEEVLGEKISLYESNLGNFENSVPKAPGMKYTHYAPKAEVVVYRGEADKIIRRIELDLVKYTSLGKKVGIICTTKRQIEDGSLEVTTLSVPFGASSVENRNDVIVKSMGLRGEYKSIASNIFRTLREFDEEDVDIILAEAVEETELGQAIMNRLIKAAGYNIVEV